MALSCVLTISPAHAASKSELISSLQSAMGYGGMIHQFKNYVLRQEPERIQKVTNKITAARTVLDEYDSVANEEEKAAITAVRAVLLEYEANLEEMIIMAMDEKTPEEIDAAVKVSDDPALEGIEVLKTQASAAEGKESALSDIQSALGYGGMIHQFKNYVLRKDEGRVQKVKAKMAEVSAAIAAYRAAGPSAAEEEALKGIEETLDAYAAGLGYEFSPVWKMGIESAGNYTEDKYYLGPTVSWASEKCWVNLGILRGLNDASDDLQFRLIVGIPF